MRQGREGSVGGRRRLPLLAAAGAALLMFLAATPSGPPAPPSSYLPTTPAEPFEALRARLGAARAGLAQRQRTLLEARYDLADRPAPGVFMNGGKPVQEGVRVRLPAGLSWDRLAALDPAEIRDRDLFPPGFLPLPHPNHPEGGMLFPRREIDELNRQEQRDLTRFDLDFDLTDHLLPPFPPPIYLTTRPDLGDLAKGRLVTLENYFELFDGILNPKQMEGLRLLLSPFPQQQFNPTSDRRGQALFFGKANCASCHPAPYYTDNLMHNLRTERFYRPREIAGAMAAGDGPIKTFPLRGIKDSPTYLHDGRLLTLEDAVEFFNLVTGTRLAAPEKRDLVAFLRQL